VRSSVVQSEKVNCNIFTDYNQITITYDSTSAPLYLRTLWHYANAASIIIITNHIYKQLLQSRLQLPK